MTVIDITHPGRITDGMDTLLLRAPIARPADGSARDGGPHYTLRLAANPEEVAAAQRLRYRVFTGELGALLRTPVPDHDVDAFDDVCDHLIVIDESTGAVVATYRLLRPGRSGIRYADSEFDLSALSALDDRLVETGRSCVDPEHRAGAAINLLWAGIARYMHQYGLRYLGGCASIGLSDGGVTAAGFRSLAFDKHLAPAEFRVTPRRPWQPPATTPTTRPNVPPLLRGYLRLGAWIGGEPAFDPDFDCADFYVLLDLTRINPRYLKHFLGEAA
jgi:putative hemolysin